MHINYETAIEKYRSQTDNFQIILLLQGHGMNLSFVGRISLVLPRVFDSKLSFFSVFKVLPRLEFINIK